MNLRAWRRKGMAFLAAHLTMRDGIPRCRVCAVISPEAARFGTCRICGGRA